MKIVFNADMRVGTRRFADGDEVELPDRFARALVTAGKATEATATKPKKAKKPEEPEPPAEDKKTYKTRQIKAEDTD